MKKDTTKVDVLAQWKNRVKKESTISSFPLTTAPAGVKIPLSSAQQRLWFLQNLNKTNTFYNYGEAFLLKGSWSVEILKNSIQEIYKSHDLLRSKCVNSEEGLELQIDENSTFLVADIDLSNKTEEEAWQLAKDVVQEDFTTVFDLTKSPLLKASVIKITETTFVLSVTMHHIITDEWSMEVFVNHLARLYNASSKNLKLEQKTRKLQFQDFAYWNASRNIAPESLDYWKQKLSGELVPLALQTDYKRPTTRSYRGSHKEIVFSENLSTELNALAKEMQVTPFVLLLSLFYALLYRHTGQADILIGSPIANRNHKEVEDMIGFFVDTLVLRNKLYSNMSFSNLVASVHQTTLEAFSNKDISFDTLVKELNPERSAALNPFFQVMFVYNAGSNYPEFGDNLSFQKTELVELQTSKFDLTLFVSEKKGRLHANFEYATDLFGATTISRFLEHLQLLASGVVQNKNSSLQELPMLTPKEKQLFFKPQAENLLTSNNSNQIGIHDLITQVASKTPKAIAVTYKDESISYETLNLRANQLAKQLMNTTKGANEIIGLCIGRSIEMIVGVLAILKAGSAYVPLDPEYPQERSNYILYDAKVNLVLTESKYKDRFELPELERVLIDEVSYDEMLSEWSISEFDSNRTAYIIYTSGSTGKPKGVPISHKNIVTSTKARFQFYDSSPKAFLLTSSISFDSSKAGIFWTLTTGGNLVIAEKNLEQDLEQLQAVIKRDAITHWLTLPTLYRILLENAVIKDLKSLTTVIVAGEACPLQLPKLHFQSLSNAKLYNEYGPTEATVWCLGYKFDAHKNYQVIPIGKPIAGVQIHLLNSKMQHVPFGAVGEIYISGEGLSQGYLNQPELSKSKFVSNPFTKNNTPQFLYKSGDLGRYLADGNIDFLGRADSQIKIRGFRIELDEIENTILQYSQVSEGAVVVYSNKQTTSNGILVAHVTVKSNFIKEELVQFLKAELPKHMVPARIIIHDSLIKLPNGKVDKKRLTNTPIEIVVESEDEIKVYTDTQKELLNIWEEVLGISGLRINDNFFEIGGDSLMTIQVISKARKANMAISPNQLFEFQTIAELASFVDANSQKKDQWDYIVPLRKEGDKTPLFCVHAGGGHVFFYNKLTDYIVEDVPIYALQPSGLYGDKIMHKTVNDMAKAYMNSIRRVQPNGPYNVLVYCFSAAVGNEIALLLKKENQEINLIVMDTMTAPATLNTPERIKIRAAAFAVRLIRSPFKTIKRMLIAKYAVWRMKWKSTHERDIEAKELEQLRLNLMQLSQSYEWRPYSGRTTVILTKKDHNSLNTETVRSWRALCENEITVIHTKGSHQLLFEEPYVKHTAAAIEECLIR